MQKSLKTMTFAFLILLLSTLMSFPALAVEPVGQERTESAFPQEIPPQTEPAEQENQSATSAAFYVGDEDSLGEAIERIVDTGIITLTSDILITNSITIPTGKAIVVQSDSAACTIRPDASMPAGGRLIIVNGNLILQNAIINGSDSHSGVFVNGGSLVLNRGGIVTRCVTTMDGGAGIKVINNGTLTMDGGEVSYNQTALTGGVSGGGIWLRDSTATMYGGIIQNNTSVWGGGVVVNIDSTFTMEGGVIQNNRTTLEHGGGVHVYVHGTFIMNGGAISGNTAGNANRQSYGGGVFVGQGTNGDEFDDWCLFIMNGGVIENNAAYVGGGVAAQWNGKLEISGGLITGNTAQAGGGIAAVNSVHGDDSVSLIMRGGEVSHNRAESAIGGGIWADSGPYLQRTKVILGTESGEDASGPQIHHNTCESESGGGITLYRNTVMDLYSGRIYENEAKKTGGGILLFNGSTLRMQGGSVNNNMAGGNGGGICTNASGNTVAVTGGSIQQNHSDASGGGVYLVSGTVATLSNSSIAYNTAAGNGGGVYTNALDTALSNLTVSGNEAADGGGIYTTAAAALSAANGTTIRENRASGDGGGIYTEGYSYANPADQTGYTNLALDTTSIFQGNAAIQAYQPPSNAASFTNIGYAQSSIIADAGSYLHPFNNYDINYTGTPPPLNLLSVTYNANEGTGSYMDSNVVIGTHYMVRSLFDTGISREGHLFTGWNTMTDGAGTPYAQGAQFQVTENVTLYAQWERESTPGGGGGGTDRPTGRKSSPTNDIGETTTVVDEAPPGNHSPDTGSYGGVGLAVWIGVACLAAGLVCRRWTAQFQ